MPNFVHPEKLERFSIGSNPTFVATFAALKDLGVGYLDGELYRLNLEALSGYGVVWAALHGADMHETLGQLHEAVCADTAMDGLRRNGS